MVARRGTWEAVVSRIGGEKVMTSGSKGAAAWETTTVRVQMLKTTKKKREYVITQTELRSRRRWPWASPASRCKSGGDVVMFSL